MSSLANQRSCVEHLIALHRRSVDDDTILDGAKQAALTLAWLERRAELVKAIDALDKAAPELARLLLDAPGTQIADVRRIGL
jgi:hypothetical protein